MSLISSITVVMSGLFLSFTVDICKGLCSLTSFWDNFCGTFVCLSYLRFTTQVHRYGTTVDVYVDMTFLFFCLSGAALPPEKEKTEHFDSNCITPVSGRLQGDGL